MGPSAGTSSTGASPASAGGASIGGRSGGRSAPGVRGLVAASATASMISHSTRSSLSAFATPVHEPERTAPSASPSRGPVRPPVGRTAGHEIRVLVLGPRLPIALAIDPQQPRDLGVPRLLEPAEPPAEGGGGVAQGPQGMAHVVLAVAIRALAVLPGLAPVDRGQAHEEGVAGELGDQGAPHLAREPAPDLEPVIGGGVVEHRTGVRGVDHLRADDRVALRRVEVPARGVHAQRPARVLDLLPRRDPERVLEEPTDRLQIGGVGSPTGRSEGVPGRAVGLGDRQLDGACPVVAAEGIGLVIPVEIAEAPGVAMDVVLGDLVVRGDAIGRRARRIRAPVTGGIRRPRRGPTIEPAIEPTSHEGKDIRWFRRHGVLPRTAEPAVCPPPRAWAMMDS